MVSMIQIGIVGSKVDIAMVVNMIIPVHKIMTSKSFNRLDIDENIKQIPRRTESITPIEMEVP